METKVRLVTFRVTTSVCRIERIGVQSGDQVVDIAAAYEAVLHSHGVFEADRVANAIIPSGMCDYLSRWSVVKPLTDESLAFAEQTGVRVAPSGAKISYQRGDYQLLAPLKPRRIKDYLTFEEHKRKGLERMGERMPASWYESPTYTNRNPLGIAGPDDEIVWPAYTRRLDFEFEIGAVVGKMGRDVSEDDALDYIVGFTIYNDLSARDIQAAERANGSGPGKSKDFDQGNVFGPCIVTTDCIDPSDIPMRVRVNGQEWSSGNTCEMAFSWAAIVRHASTGETIYPGDILASGTMNRGCGLELDRWLNNGDILELEADGIGILRNRIVGA
jgi:2-keto-4-pentenoate hydratase/2-oxohepta-3-ene-1,7-dioic acid hydratase in catechol pathway